MFSLDDRTGDVVTTVALYLLVAAVVYRARGALFIVLLSLLFADLLEPAVGLLEQHSPIGRNNRSWAIAQVYFVGTLALCGVAWKFGPHVALQMKHLRVAVPKILEGVSNNGGTAAGNEPGLRSLLANHSDILVRVFDRTATSLSHLAASAIWLMLVPILAIFFLQDRRRFADVVNGASERRCGGPSRVQRIVRQVDIMLARYIRAQLALCGLSFVFYSLSLLLLGFPSPVALGILGGALEFLPAVGWITAAVTILSVGFLTRSYWLGMAGLLIVWRLIQDYVNAPRIMGKTMELEPLTVIIALMIGGEVGGIAGVYLSVPVAAILRIVWSEIFSPRNSSTVPCDEVLVQTKS
jgi:predicted PurR-regulated permease PerM